LVNEPNGLILNTVWNPFTGKEKNIRIAAIPILAVYVMTLYYLRDVYGGPKKVPFALLVLTTAAAIIVFYLADKWFESRSLRRPKQ